MNNEEKILQILGRLVEDVSGLKEDVSGLKEDVSGLKEDVSGLKEDVSGLKREVSVLKEEFSELRQDVDFLKEDSANMRETLTRVAVTQESLVLPRLDMLAEGQAALKNTLAPKDDVEKRLITLESDMSTLKTVVRTHSDRLAELEKAQ